jgi:hypothetical protein
MESPRLQSRKEPADPRKKTREARVVSSVM